MFCFVCFSWLYVDIWLMVEVVLASVNFSMFSRNGFALRYYLACCFKLETRVLKTPCCFTLYRLFLVGDALVLQVMIWFSRVFGHYFVSSHEQWSSNHNPFKVEQVVYSTCFFFALTAFSNNSQGLDGPHH